MNDFLFRRLCAREKFCFFLFFCPFEMGQANTLWSTWASSPQLLFFFSCNRERKRSRMMAGQSVLCIVINDLTFFLLFGCRRKFSFSLSNPDTACHFHFFLHTHKHTHTFWACENVYIFMFFMSPLPSQLLLRVLGIHGRKLFSFFYSFYFCICTCTQYFIPTLLVVWLSELSGWLTW